MNITCWTMAIKISHVLSMTNNNNNSGIGLRVGQKRRRFYFSPRKRNKMTRKKGKFFQKLKAPEVQVRAGGAAVSPAGKGRAGCSKRRRKIERKTMNAKKTAESRLVGFGSSVAVGRHFVQLIKEEGAGHLKTSSQLFGPCYYYIDSLSLALCWPPSSRNLSVLLLFTGHNKPKR